MGSSSVRTGAGRRARCLAAVASGALALGALPAAAAQGARVAGPPGGARQAVIVVMADQVTGVPDTRAHAAARASAVRAAQSPVLAALRADGAQDVKSISVLNAVAASVTGAQAAALRAEPGVSAIVPDAAIRLPAPSAEPTAAPAIGPRAAVSLPPDTCAPNGRVQLDPEADEAIHAVSEDPGAETARSLGMTGAGVVVGDIAGSIDVDTPELVRPDGSHVIADYQDFTGEGGAVESEDLESFLDDGMIAAQGDGVYNLQDYTVRPLAQPCLIKVVGVSPGVTLDAYKVYAADDFTTTSAFLEAIDYAVTVDHVNVLNEEGGSFPMPDTSADLIKSANAAAIAAGVVITSPSYDAGPTDTIWSPSSQQGVISVGASTTFRSYAQSDTAGYDDIGATGYVSDNISALSSGGATEQGRSVDVVAPGDLDWAICTADPQIAPDCLNAAGQPTAVMQSGGTSEAGPLVAGVAALVIQAYRGTHGGATPAPQLVDDIITSTADDLGVVGSEQGAGLVDAYRAVREAQSVHTADGSPKAAGDSLLMSTQQLDAIGDPGSAQDFSVQLTNTGADTQTVSLAGRTLGASHVVASMTATLADGGSAYVDAYGYTHNEATVTFTVPKGQDRLDADIAYPGGSALYADLTLLDPHGLLTGYSLPQGYGNHGHIDLRDPVPGTWTAVITDYTTSVGGYVGPVQFQAAVSTFEPFGSVTPARVTLKAGASTTVRVDTTLPTTPGDLSASLAVSSPQSGDSSIPMTLRTVIPIKQGVGTFTGSLVGGNGRGGVPAQTMFYAVNVPANEPALDVQMALGHQEQDAFYAYLIAPDGSNPARASDQVLLNDGQSVESASGARLHVIDPQAGQWTVILTFTNPVLGDALATPLYGVVDFAPVRAATAGVPNGATLPTGKAHTVSVTVHNGSDSVESYFLDARLNRQVTLPLAAIVPVTDITLPESDQGYAPQWIVPTQTTQLSAEATSTAPVQFDTQPYNGDPDLGSTAFGDNAYVSYSAPEVTQGDWDLIAQPTGAFGDAGAPASTASFAMSVTTQAFDPAVASPSGDLWLQAVDPQAAFAPVIVQPGESATLYLTITPSGAAGSTVSGTLYLDDVSELSQYGYAPTGDELAAIPYQYTVG
jgi:Subtilase family